MHGKQAGIWRISQLCDNQCAHQGGHPIMKSLLSLYGEVKRYSGKLFATGYSLYIVQQFNNHYDHLWWNRQIFPTTRYYMHWLKRNELQLNKCSCPYLLILPPVFLKGLQWDVVLIIINSAPFLIRRHFFSVSSGIFMVISQRRVLYWIYRWEAHSAQGLSTYK